MDNATKEAKQLKETIRQALGAFDSKTQFEETEVEGRWQGIRWMLLMAMNDVTYMHKKWSREVT